METNVVEIGSNVLTWTYKYNQHYGVMLAICEIYLVEGEGELYIRQFDFNTHW